MEWRALPVGLRQAVEERIGSAVLRADGTVGGFSAGFAGILRTARGSVFVKATSEAVNSHGRALYRQEWRACRQLGQPDSVDIGFEWAFDWRDWTVLAFRAVDAGICSPAWPAGQLKTVLHHLHTHRVPAPPGLPPLDTYFGEAFAAWSALAADPGFDTWPLDEEGNPLLPPREWADLAERARSALAGSDLLHADLRADNILWTGGAPILIDWAYACRGSAVFDPLYLLLEVACNRGDPPEDALRGVLERYDCHPDDATALLAVFGGWFTWMSRMPPPPGLPTLRVFQRDMADAALSWFRHRLSGGGVAIRGRGPDLPGGSAADDRTAPHTARTADTPTEQSNTEGRT
ncbi:phosphotransferase [Streptomyces sp. TP-A0874]|uniref:phosphotransferase n=1 Tax=Streptomyces sp. TP-A0874 TaxID=549819 RepID=UPI000853CC3C|nr:phosphotransferase [Streptomyces sp. TP-A0874]